MGNGVMAKGPQATAPILDSTNSDIRPDRFLRSFGWYFSIKRRLPRPR